MSSALAVPSRVSQRKPRPRPIAALSYVLGGAAVLGAVTSVGSPPSLVLVLGGGIFIALGIWMLCSERYELTLAVLMIYLGIADGYLKLRTGSSVMTLARDVLLYAIVAGAVIRWIVRREQVCLPPMSAWILLYTGLILAEMFNPGTGGIHHALPALRPDLEFVPLFFFGYAVMRSRGRLRAFLFILLFICAANGVVSLVQFGDSPSQLASWGPGYSQKVLGTGTVSGRVFTDSSGNSHVRPFGLQSDAGGGGNTGMLGVAAAIALLGPLRRRWWPTLLAACLSIGTVLALVTSDGRGAVLAAFAAVVAYVFLSVVSKRLVPTLLGVLVGAGLTFAVVSIVASGAQQGALSRYSTISPSNVVSTESSSRGFSLADVPQYVVKYPLGAGLGSTGPASGVGRAVQDLDGETEFTFLLLEAGVMGFILVLGFHTRILVWCMQRIRRFNDPELRTMLAALAAPLFGIFALYFGGSATTTSPTAPYLWFVSGILVYWFTEALQRESHRSTRYRGDAALDPRTQGDAQLGAVAPSPA